MVSSNLLVILINIDVRKLTLEKYNIPSHSTRIKAKIYIMVFIMVLSTKTFL